MPLLRRLGLASLLVSALALWSVQAQEEALPSNTESVLSKALSRQLAALNGEDPDQVMALFHPQAPGLEESRRGLVTMFRTYDLQYTLDAKHYVGVDEPYAYMRIVQTTRGAKLKASRTEQLFVFKRHQRDWMFWTSVVLEKRPLPPSRR